MIISKTCSLISSPVFYYDVPACNFNLLKFSNKEQLGGVNFDNKRNRNIKIGIKQRNNISVKKFLNFEIDSVIDDLISVNILKEENILCKAKDGFISDKKIEHDIEGINILLKSNISKFIIDIERRKYLSIEFNGNIDVKGLINKPDDISFFDFFKKLDYNNTNNLSRLIEENRKIFLSSDNINYFKRKVNDENLIPIKNMGLIKIKDSDLDIINVNQIDKKFIWEEFVWPFCQSILLYSLKQKK